MRSISLVVEVCLSGIVLVYQSSCSSLSQFSLSIYRSSGWYNKLAKGAKYFTR